MGTMVNSLGGGGTGGSCLIDLSKSSVTLTISEYFTQSDYNNHSLSLTTTIDANVYARIWAAGTGIDGVRVYGWYINLSKTNGTSVKVCPTGFITGGKEVYMYLGCLTKNTIITTDKLSPVTNSSWSTSSSGYYYMHLFQIPLE